MRHLLLICFLCCFLLGCNTDDEKSKSSVVADLSKGQWELVYFFRNNLDQTNLYTALHFDFSEKGLLKVSNELFNNNGSWKFITNAINENNFGSEIISLHFSELLPLTTLNDNWTILSASANTLELFREDPADGHLDFLTFSRQKNPPSEI